MFFLPTKEEPCPTEFNPARKQVTSAKCKRPSVRRRVFLYFLAVTVEAGREMKGVNQT